MWSVVLALVLATLLEFIRNCIGMHREITRHADLCVTAVSGAAL